MLLSIIVPVYNVEKYLAKCLDSLLNQDIAKNSYEIIIVNDGSTDLSLSIAQDYANKFDIVKIISKINGGLGSARNVGIEKARGNYLFFVDSDDYIKENTIGKLIKQIETNKLDALRFGCELVNEAGQNIPKTKNSTYSIVNEGQEVTGETFLTDQLGWACYVWTYLFDTNFIKKNNFLFNEDIYFEDVEWLVRVLMVAKKVQSINYQVYYYLQRSGSITQSTDVQKKNKIITDKIFIIDWLNLQALKTKNIKVNLWCKGMVALLIMGVLAYIQNELPGMKKEIIKSLYIKNILPLSAYRFTIKQKRDLFIINVSPQIYCYLKKRKIK